MATSSDLKDFNKIKGSFEQARRLGLAAAAASPAPARSLTPNPIS